MKIFFSAFSASKWGKVVLLWSAGLFLQAQSLYFPPTGDTSWATLSPERLGWDTTRIDSLYHFLRQNRTKAFLLLKDGKIVIEWYFGSFTRDSFWYWASAGKGLTAFLVGIAQQEGYLQITDPAAQWLGPGWTSAPPHKGGPYYHPASAHHDFRPG